MSNLIEEHPLHVHYPRGGHVTILHWYCENEGHKIIVNGSGSGFDKAVDRLLKNPPYMFKFVSFYKGQLISPPKSFHVLYAEKKEESNRNSWKSIVAAKIIRYQGEMLGERYSYDIISNEGLPLGVSRCPDMKEKYEHYHCNRCFEGFIIGNKSPAELWRHAKSDYLALVASWGHNRKEGAPPRGPTVGEGAPFYVVGPDFGPHRSGIGIGLVTPDKWEDTISHALSYQPLFFFKGEELPIPERYASVLEEINKKDAEQKERDEAQRKLRSKRRDKEVIQEGLEIVEKILSFEKLVK